MRIRFIKNKRAIVIGKNMVIADLHIGYEKNITEKGFRIPNQKKFFVSEIREIKRITKANNLIILGDVKHNIPFITRKEKYDVLFFIEQISKLFNKVTITKGNHDGMLDKIINVPNVEIVKEYLLDEFAFLHGHSYPSKEAINKKTIVMGHVHPTLKIRDGESIHFYPCWIIGSLNKEKLKKKYKQIKCEKVIVVPSFNPLTSGYEELTGPLAKAIVKEEVYLLDLTKVL